MKNRLNPAVQLFSLGFLTLFLELALIRYLSGNIWNLGYFPNLVLLGVFTGMAIGFVFHQSVRDEQSPRYFHMAAVALLVLMAFVTFFRPVVPGFHTTEGNFGGDLYFTAAAKYSHFFWAPVSFLVWFFSIVSVFALIAQHTAKLFRQFAPLKAYTLDIAGSVAGILSFMLISWFQLPAYLWFAALIPLFFLAGFWNLRTKQAFTGFLVLAAVFGFTRYQDTRLLADSAYRGMIDTRWSPYQKLEFINTQRLPYEIFANGIAHQSMEQLSSILRTNIGIPYSAPYAKRATEPGRAPYKRVLILGAGSGNDVAAALANGAEHIDAVEIDPSIAALGKKYHPAQPYADPRVHLTIDDGRAFMTRAKSKYDLIIFALTDSIVKVSPMAQLRLENYLFTVDSVKKAASLLTEDGDILFYNYYRQPWLRSKIAMMAQQATGHYPNAIFEHYDFAMLIAGKHNQGAAPATSERLDIPTDDWPFLYLKQRGIPSIYFLAMLVMGALVTALMVYLNRKGRQMQVEGARIYTSTRTKIAFALMGVSFLLLETKSVIQFSLLFGTTWLNNSLVFLAVLVLVLAANWAAYLFKNNRVLPVAFALLIGSCLVTLFYPLSDLLSIENAAERFVLASLMTFSPIFFANLIFSIAFREQAVPEHVFGWNLLGASLGGMVEYSSMALGYNALAIVVALCYTLTFALLMAERKQAVAEDTLKMNEAVPQT